MGAASAISVYRQIETGSGIEDASPTQLIGMLLNGALDRIATAKGHLERGEVGPKGNQIGRAISIIGGLRSSLRLDIGDIATNLESLYDYMERRLLSANLSNDTAALDEVADLLREIKTAWDTVLEQPATTAGSQD